MSILLCKRAGLNGSARLLEVFIEALESHKYTLPAIHSWRQLTSV